MHILIDHLSISYWSRLKQFFGVIKLKSIYKNIHETILALWSCRLDLWFNFNLVTFFTPLKWWVAKISKWWNWIPWKRKYSYEWISSYICRRLCVEIMSTALFVIYNTAGSNNAIIIVSCMHVIYYATIKRIVTMERTITVLANDQQVPLLRTLQILV